MLKNPNTHLWGNFFVIPNKKFDLYNSLSSPMNYNMALKTRADLLLSDSETWKYNKG